MTKAPIPTEKSQKQRDNTKQNATKISITPRMRTDLGQSNGVATATLLVWLKRCTSAKPSH